MSIQAVAWALDQDLPPRPKLVLISIANHANHTDGYCWLKAETIAQEASCSPRAVFNFVGALIRNGYVRKSVRRGEDGKQRANDYWILLDRPPTEWIGERSDAEPETDDAETSEQAEAEPQDVAEPHAPRACGETAGPPVENPSPTAPRASGPHAPACMHKESAEPSKTNPSEARARTPRHYRRPPPPPPEPQAAVAGANAELIFVFRPSKAYDAWARFKEAERRSRGDYRPFTNVTFRNGKAGWYFPSLFPPGVGPPPSELMTEEDAEILAKTG